MAMIKTIESIKNNIELSKAQSRARFEDVQRQVDELRKRLDNLETPKQSHRGGRGGPKRIATPVPDRPAVMQAAGVGEDPR